MQVKVKKYTKKKNGLYHILFENGKTLDLYEEVILKYNLLISPLEVSMMYEIEKCNKEWDAYYVALKYIKYKARTVNEIRVYLKKKEYSNEIIDKMVTKLESQGYLNDLSYSKSFLNMKILTTTHGPNRVREDLRKRGVSSKIIEEVMEEYTDDIQREKIKKIISKKINSNHNKSARVLKQKILSELLNAGFSRDMISEEMSKHTIKNDPDLVKKEYQKIYNKLSRKYEGEELKYKIKQKMYQKGLDYDEIY